MAHIEGSYILTNPQGDCHDSFTLLTFVVDLRPCQVDLPDVWQLVPFDEAFPGYEVEEG